jgi:hypothetical protein
MFEHYMDEYLDDEFEFVKHGFDVMRRTWVVQVCPFFALPYMVHVADADYQSCFRRAISAATSSIIQQQPRFLSTTDPSNSQVLKRSVLTSFTNSLLLPLPLPVRLVPRAVGGGTMAFGARFNTGIVGTGAEMKVSGNAAA